MKGVGGGGCGINAVPINSVATWLFLRVLSTDQNFTEGMGGGGGETHTERQRDRDRQTDRQTDRKPPGSTHLEDTTQLLDFNDLHVI